jgi:hypothetical protein
MSCTGRGPRLPFVLSFVLFAFLAVTGCKKQPSNTATPSPTAAAAPDPPASSNDSHLKVARDLLAASKELTQALFKIQNASDAQAAAPKLEDLAARHEAIAARVAALPEATPEETAELKRDVEPDFIKEGARVTEQLRQLFHDDEAKKVILPYVQRMGGAVYAVAEKSHLNPTDPKKERPAGVVADPATKQRITQLREVQKSVPVPKDLQNVRAGKEYAANVAPLVRDYKPERVVAVKFDHVATSDNEFMPRLLGAGQKLRLAGSNPVTVMVDRKTMNVFVAYAPVTDLEDLAKKVVELHPGTTSSVDAAERVIIITRGDAPGTPAAPGQ